VKEILEESPSNLFLIEGLFFSKKDKHKREQIKNLILRHNSHRN